MFEALSGLSGLGKGTGHVLETLGLGVAAEKIYREMLKHPDDGVADMAEHLQLSVEDVRSGLDRLSELALIFDSPALKLGLAPISPEMAMELLLARQKADLAAQQLQIEESRAAAARLIAECTSFRPPSVDEGERLVGPDEIRTRLALLADSAEYEVSTLAPGGAHAPDDLAASREPNAKLLDREVVVRTIYLDSARNDAATAAHIESLVDEGAQVRTAPTLPIRMVLVDERVAVLPIDTEDARAGAVVLQGAGTVAALCALFESEWDRAVPYGRPAVPDQFGLAPNERATLTLLAQGHTDEVVAKRLGVSPRTARRIAAELMERVGARSRFQAGIEVARNGWLDPVED